MPNVYASDDRAAQLAGQVLDDLRGAGYYADPSVLADIIKVDSQTTADDERNAVELLRLILRMFSTGEQQMKTRVADAIRGYGIR